MKCKHEWRFINKTWDCGVDFFYCIYCLKRKSLKEMQKQDAIRGREE